MKGLAEVPRTEASVVEEKVVLVTILPPPGQTSPADRRDPLAELRSLAETAGATVADEMVQRRNKPDPRCYIGRGKLEELAQRIRDSGANAVVFDNDLSPAQIRNVEQAVGGKILDRSEVILDIFAHRARTYEAKLQVELAQLEYTYPRLRAMWSHLERIAGGAPAGIGTRGPGEKQIEIDRRIVQQRRSDLVRQLDRIQKRKRRQVSDRNEDFFTVGLVGYTNAGKSTLFNTLTDAGAYADDKLFATLDTRTRAWALGGGDEVLLSDTVGFVRDLPHHLVASFRATLEESLHADLLLVVVDITDPLAREHLRTIDHVLDEVGARDRPRVLLLNKVDQVEDETELLLWSREQPDAHLVSARSGVGLDQVVERVRSAARGRMLDVTLRVPLADGRAMHFLENRAAVHQRNYDTTHVTFRATIGQRPLQELRATGATFEVLEEQSAEAA